MSDAKVPVNSGLKCKMLDDESMYCLVERPKPKPNATPAVEVTPTAIVEQPVTPTQSPYFLPPQGMIGIGLLSIGILGIYFMGLRRPEDKPSGYVAPQQQPPPPPGYTVHRGQPW